MDSEETILLGGGCFWCTEAVFKMLKGIISVESGYAGGDKINPTYKEVSSGTTGHAEVVKITYNSEIISLEDILTVFFSSHDPTTKDRQGNDIGSQYRSVILYETDKQKEIIEKFIEDINSSSKEGNPVVTELKKIDNFYTAEDYHKNYYENNKNQLYCQVVINPKLRKVQEKFKELIK